MLTTLLRCAGLLATPWPALLQAQARWPDYMPQPWADTVDTYLDSIGVRQ